MQGMCSSGTYAAFRGVCDHLGLTKILKSYFPENWELMLTAAQYMLSEGNVMYYLKDYTESHKTSVRENVDDARISRMFSELRKEDMLLFFREWMRVKKSGEYIAYDVTSFSSYGREFPSWNGVITGTGKSYPRSIWECTTGRKVVCPYTTAFIRGAFRIKPT